MQIVQRGNFTCPICFIRQTSYEKTSLPCRCYACTDCLSEWLALKITEHKYSMSSQVPCFMTRCKKEPFTLRIIHQKMPLLCKQKLNESLFQVYLTKKQDIRKCPNSACNYAGVISLNSSCKASLQCDLCGTTWRDKSHYTKPEKLLAWLRNGPTWTEEERSQQWIKSKAKKCPVCHTNIQKNGGCDHMTCTKCKCEFCWVCCRVYPHHDRKMHRNLRNIIPSIGTFITLILIILVLYFVFKYVFFPLFAAIATGIFGFLYSSLAPVIGNVLAANAFTGLLIATFSTFNIPMHVRVCCFIVATASFAVSLHLDYFGTMVNIMKIEMVILPIGMALFILLRGCLTTFSRDISRPPITRIQPARITRQKTYEKRPKTSEKPNYFKKSFIKTARR